jgi:hypothetical protein
LGAVIFSGDKTKALLPALGLGDAATIRSGTADPQSTPTAGNRGDVYIRTGASSTIYQKITSDGTDTNWSLVPSSVSGLSASSVVVTDTLGNIKTDGGITYDSATDTLGVVKVNTPSLQRASAGTLAIGDDGNSTTINIGTTGSTINLQGTTVYQNVTNANVANKQINLNVGGGVGTATNSGVEIQENSIITGYVQTSSDRNSWQLLAPNTVGIITLTPGAGGFTIDQGSHNPLTIGTANGLSLSTQALSLAAADGLNAGALTAGTQTIGGAKTFSSTISASNFSGSSSGTNTGDVTLAVVGSVPNANGASLSGQALNLQPANGTFPGALLSADWTTFNNKQSALTFGAISTSTTGVTVGSGSNSTVGPNVTVDIQTASGSQPGLLSSTDWTTFNNKQSAGSYPISSAGDLNETSFSLANNQAAAANVTGLAFANGTVRSAKVLYSAFIDATSDLFESGELLLVQKGSTWTVSRAAQGDNSLLTFDVTNAGQVQYTSANYTGFSTGTLKFRAITTSI